MRYMSFKKRLMATDKAQAVDLYNQLSDARYHDCVVPNLDTDVDNIGCVESEIEHEAPLRSEGLKFSLAYLKA